MSLESLARETWPRPSCGACCAGVLRDDQLITSDVSPQRRELFAQLGVRAVESNVEAAGDARMVLLSVKPQQMAQVLGDIAPRLHADALVISIAAGISTKFIEKHLGERRTIRTMPNTPMLLGEGMVAMAPGRLATGQDMQAARRIFEASATVLEVGEDKMDAVTAVSGSGPAYFFFLVEQLIAAGVDLGLTGEQAHTLATRTALGAAKMMSSLGEPPQELRRRVTSKGGTTQAAIETMEARGVPQAIVERGKASGAASRELGG